MKSGITFHADATDGASRRLGVSIEITGPFVGNILEMRFPRWIPGSYLIREPMQHLTDLSAFCDGKEVKVQRIDVDGLRIKGISESSKVLVTYKVLSAEMTCRANHLDKSHVHIMPPYTWMIPTRGIESGRMELSHRVTLDKPNDWQTAIQLPGKEGEWFAEGRDELLDAIIESNPNKLISFEIEGCTQHLKLWDSGSLDIPKRGLDRFVEAMKAVVKEHYALFGVPEWKEYWTVLHLTNSGRGGLEHLRSQTSMMPRRCLQEGNEDDWLDLVSLFSHEFLHQWNVNGDPKMSLITTYKKKYIRTCYGGLRV
jgi:predicted metalloprotease with PDZ domain